MSLLISEYSFTPSSVAVSNLNMLSLLQSESEERRICELAEIAYSAAEFSSRLSVDGISLCEILSLISDSVSFVPENVHKDAYDRNVLSLSSYLNAMTAFDKASFCRLYVERLRDFHQNVVETDLILPSSALETFVYVKNAFADEAYDVFSQEFNDPRVRYAQNLKEALNLVRSKEVTYALLPFEERGSRLQTVEQLIFSGDFKINALTPVFGFDGTADMKYALVSSDFINQNFEADDDRYLEIRLEKNPELSLSELLFAAESYGVKLYRVNTHTFNTDDEKKEYFSVVFKSEGADFSLLLIYLTLFVPEHTAVGIYKNLE